MSYLQSLALTKTLPCLAYPGKLIVFGKPSCSLEKVTPYLATLPDVITYNPHTATLTFRRRAGFITIYPDQVYITRVDSTEHGLELLEALRAAINTTWEHRQELVAVTTIRRAPRPLDVWTLLPQTNCQQCGEQTCMAFACNLLLSERELEECLPLKTDPAFGERRLSLAAMLG